MNENEEFIMEKGMDCLYENFGVVEVEMIASAIIKSSYDYTKWRQGYFENAYINKNGTQLENFLATAAKHDPYGKSFVI